MRRSASTITRCEAKRAQPSTTAVNSAMPSSSIGWRDAQRRVPGRRMTGPGVRIAASARHRSACSASKPGLVGEHLGQDVRRHLVELVDDAHHRADVGRADAAVEALDQLAVVDLQA